MAIKDYFDFGFTKKKEEAPTQPAGVIKDNPNLENVIELKKVEQTYGDTTIIKDLDLVIEKVGGKGRFTVILGPSGCGKSTLLRYIAGLQNPTNGDVLINDKPRTDEDHVGMVFQKYSSFPWRSVLENVYYGVEVQSKMIDRMKIRLSKLPIIGSIPFFKNKGSEVREQAMNMIKTVGLQGHEHKYAQYPTLSGGQLQRVAIARSLLSTPDILLMDEPFGALDVPTRLQMQDMLVDIWEKLNPTVVLVTHDIPEAVYLADDIYIMSHAPSKIAHHIDVAAVLPYNRKGIKRDPKFTQLVHKVEDLMMQVDSSKK
jgi:NitT/TauT family transport system ATP-binding protein